MILYTSVQLIGQTRQSTRAACTVQGKINAVDGTNLFGPVGSTWKQFRIRRISKATLEKSRFAGIISSPEGIVCRDKKRHPKRMPLISADYLIYQLIILIYRNGRKRLKWKADAKFIGIGEKR